MNYLIAGLVLFTAVHLIPSAPGVRAGLISRITAGGYKGLFSGISLVGIVLIVMGLKRVEFVQWYVPPEWGRHAAMALMLPALYLFLSNSVIPVPSSAQALTANPANWSVVLWSGAHLLANGDQAHVLMFGTFLAFSLFSILTSHFRGLTPALSERPPLAKELVFLVIVLVIYGGLIGGHAYFSGVPLV